MFEERAVFIFLSFIVSFFMSWLYRKKRTSFSDAYTVLLGTSFFSLFTVESHFFSVISLLLLSFSLLFFSHLKVDRNREKVFLFLVCLLGTYGFTVDISFLFRLYVALFWYASVLCIWYFDRVERLSFLVLSAWGVFCIYLLWYALVPFWMLLFIIILTSSLIGNVYGSKQKNTFVLGKSGSLSIGYLYASLPSFLLSKGFVFSSIMYLGYYLTELVVLLIMGIFLHRSFKNSTFLIENKLLKVKNKNKFYFNLFMILFLILFLNMQIALLSNTQFTLVSFFIMMLLILMIFVEPNKEKRVTYRQLFTDVFDGVKVLGTQVKKSFGKQKR